MLANSKLLFLLGNLELGGAERQALVLARHLQNQEGAKVEVWGMGKPEHVSDICQMWGIPWKQIHVHFGSGFVADTIALISLARQLRNAAPDVLLPYTWFPNILCGLLWRLVGCRICIWNQRDSGIGLDPKRLAHRMAVRHTPFFISNSVHGAGFLVEKFKVNRPRIEVIPNGVTSDALRSDRTLWRSRLGAGDTDFVACMIANFSELKDHSTAIRAWRPVRDQLSKEKRRALLVFAGRDDGTAETVSALIKELCLEDDVFILGPVDDVTGLLRSCDLAVHCAEHEGCPNAVLEEMAAGLAIIASDNDGVRMVLGETAETCVAAYQDWEGIAQRILHFATDENLRVSVGGTNRRRVLHNFGIERMCNDTVHFIENALRHTL